MAEYIDREALLKRLCDDDPSHMEDYYYNAIADYPTADVVEVRHGEWVEHFAFDCWHYDCPFCDDGYATKGREKHPANYCSNCGAKLDGKDEGEW